MTLANLLAWCGQVAALVTIGIMTAQLYTWRHPHSRLRFFQLLLAVSLLLPLLEPWRVRPIVFSRAVHAVPIRITQAAPPKPIPTSIDWERLMLFILAAGIVVQLGRLGLGLAKLRTVRRCGQAIRIDGVVGVEVREVQGLKGPAAFGWLEPVILLPAEMPTGPTRSAAVRHELQHVIRRDWLENMIERTAASILWFHPAVWWLLERIHLAREQAVDHEVAGAGRERDQYLHSLLTSAGLANPPALPVAGFIRRPRHLVERVAFLSKETTMSIPQTVASAALATILSGAALTVAAFYLPLRLSAQQSSADDPLHWTRPSPKTEGTVQLDVTVNSDGDVVDARVVSGPTELRKPALQSVLFWRYKADSAESRVLPITIDFKKLNAPAGVIVGGILGGVHTAVTPPAPEKATFEGVDYSGLSTDLQQRAAALLASIHTGQKLTNAQIDQLRHDLAALDPSLRLGMQMRDMGNGDMLRLLVHNNTGMAQPPQQIRVGAGVQQMNLIQRVDPVYPTEAREARIQGTVRFNIMVDKEGAVGQATLVAGHPLLVQAAQEAVKQYKYRPTMLNGQPITVQTTVDVNFIL